MNTIKENIIKLFELTNSDSYKYDEETNTIEFNYYQLYFNINFTNSNIKIYLSDEFTSLDNDYDNDNDIKKKISNLYNVKDIIITNVGNNKITYLSHKLFNVLKFNYYDNSYGSNTTNFIKNMLNNHVFYYVPITISINKSNILSKINQIIYNIKEFELHPDDYCFYTGNLKSELLESYYKNSDLKALEAYSYDESEPDFIKNYYQSHNCNFNLLFQLLINCISSSRRDIIWNPCIEVKDKDFDIKTKTLKGNDEMLTLVLNTLVDIYEQLNIITNDYQLFSLSPYSYIILKHAIMHFKEYNLEQWNIDDSSNELHKLCEKGNIQVLRVVYEDKDKQDKFPDSCDRLFHGSTNQNWYSIMFNGLKVATRDNGLFLNGAAYGTGIYLSNTINYSYSYSGNVNKGHNSTDALSKSLSNQEKKIQNFINKRIIGVFAIKNMDKYKKTSGIYVVNEPGMLQLQYLVVFNNNCVRTDIFRSIDTYFIKTIKGKLENEKIEVVKLGSKRLMKEIAMLHKGNDKMDDSGLHYICEMNDSDMTKIKLKLPLDNFDKDSDLYKDLVRFGYDCVKVEMDIPERYPFNPPFVRIVSPRFKFMTGHITSGGSICMEILTNQGWSAGLNIIKVLIVLKLEMIAGGARLDPINHRTVYSISEAKSAYKRMLQSHGWK